MVKGLKPRQGSLTHSSTSHLERRYVAKEMLLFCMLSFLRILRRWVLTVLPRFCPYRTAVCSGLRCAYVRFVPQLCWPRASTMLASRIYYVCRAHRLCPRRDTAYSGSIQGVFGVATWFVGDATRFGPAPACCVRSRSAVCSASCIYLVGLVHLCGSPHTSTMSEASIGYVGRAHLCIKAVGTTIITPTIGMYKKKAARHG